MAAMCNSSLYKVWQLDKLKRPDEVVLETWKWRRGAGFSHPAGERSDTRGHPPSSRGAEVLPGQGHSVRGSSSQERTRMLTRAKALIMQNSPCLKEITPSNSEFEKDWSHDFACASPSYGF